MSARRAENNRVRDRAREPHEAFVEVEPYRTFSGRVKKDVRSLPSLRLA